MEKDTHTERERIRKRRKREEKEKEIQKNILIHKKITFTIFLGRSLCLYQFTDG